MQGRFLEQFGARLRDRLFNRRCRRAHFALGGKLPDAQDDFRHERLPGHPIHFFEKYRLEECELLQPDRVMDVDVKFLESDLIGARVGRDRFAHNLWPMAS